MEAVGSFTAATVYDLLRNGVLDPNGSACVGVGSPVCAHLAICLNLMQQKVAGWQGPWQEIDADLKKIATAIDTLATLLPPTRAQYTAHVEIVEDNRWNLPGNEISLALEKRRLAALDALIAAARTAREEGLPILSMFYIASPQPVTQRTDIAGELAKIFHDAFPGAGKKAGYRFIVAVTPHLTGEAPTFDAVQQHLKRSRRGNGDIQPS